MLIININRCFRRGGGGSFSLLLSRLRSSSSSSCSWQRRWLSSLSQQQQIGSDHHQQSIILQGPCLMLSSLTKPQSALFFDPLIQQQQEEEDKQEEEEGTTTNNNNIINSMKMNLRLNFEVHLPEVFCIDGIGSSEGYLITYDGNCEYIQATNPLTGARLPPFPSTLPLAEAAPRADDPSGDQAPLTLYSSYYHIFRSKVILSPSLDTVVIVYGGMYLNFARLIGGGDSWSSDWYSVDSKHFLSTQDLIFHEGLLHCVNGDGVLSILDIKDPSGPIITSPAESFGQECVDSSLKKCYVVESPGGDDLFLVYRQKCPHDDVFEGFDVDDNEDYGTIVQRLAELPDENINLEISELFKVFKFDKKRDYKLDQVDRLEDFAIFVGSNRSAALSVRDYPTLKPNCIYFTDDFCDYFWQQPELIGDTGVFNLEDGSIHFFQLTTDDGLQKLNRPVWFIPSKLSASSQIASKDLQVALG